MRYISASELDKKIKARDKVVVLDIREQYELDICKIDSMHIPMGEIHKRIDEIPKDVDVVILCRSGKRAIAVSNFLEIDFGRKNIVILEGGILAWIEEIDNQLEVY